MKNKCPDPIQLAAPHPDEQWRYMMIEGNAAFRAGDKDAARDENIAQRRHRQTRAARHAQELFAAY